MMPTPSTNLSGGRRVGLRSFQKYHPNSTESKWSGGSVELSDVNGKVNAELTPSPLNILFTAQSSKAFHYHLLLLLLFSLLFILLLFLSPFLLLFPLLLLFLSLRSILFFFFEECSFLLSLFLLLLFIFFLCVSKFLPNSSEKKDFRDTPVTSVNSSYTPAKDAIVTEFTGFGLYSAPASDANKGFRTYFSDDKKHDPKASTLSTSSIWTNPSPHSASSPELAPSISTSTRDDDSEMSLPHFRGSLNQILNADSDSNSETITAICDSQCQTDSAPMFTEQRVFSDTTAQQPKSRALSDIDISQELSAPPLLGDASRSGSLPSPPHWPLSDTLRSPSRHSEEGHEEGSHSEPCCLVEQPIALPLSSCAIERKLGPFDQSRTLGSCLGPVGEVPDPPNFGHFLGITTPQIPTRHFSSDWILSVHHDWGTPGSSPEPVGEVPDPPNFGHFLGITTPQIPTRHFSSDWILSVHHDWGTPGSSPEPVGEVPDPPNFGHFLGVTTSQIPTRRFSSDRLLSLHQDWGWLPNIGGGKALAPDKRNISRFISHLLAEWASSSPGAFNNANGFGIHGSSFANAQNVHYTINNYGPGQTGNLGQSLCDSHLQQQIEQLQKRVKQLEDELMISRRNEDRTEREFSDYRQSPHRQETRLPPGPEPPPDKPEQRNESLPEGFQYPSGLPSDNGSTDELLSRIEKLMEKQLRLMEIAEANQRKELAFKRSIEEILLSRTFLLIVMFFSFLLFYFSSIKTC